MGSKNLEGNRNEFLIQFWIQLEIIDKLLFLCYFEKSNYNSVLRNKWIMIKYTESKFISPFTCDGDIWVIVTVICINIFDNG